jgi:hypothetical protein
MHVVHNARFAICANGQPSPHRLAAVETEHSLVILLPQSKWSTHHAV